MEQPTSVITPTDTTVVIRARRPRRRVDGLAELLDRRVDLRGAYPPADYLEEAIRWSA